MAMTQRIDLFRQPEEERERRDAAANRALLLETAARLFAARGVAAVSMAEIAQEAGVGKGTLYRRFAHKGEICLGLMNNQLKAFQDEQLEMMRQMSAAGEPYLQQLERFLRALVVFTEEHMPLLYEVEQYSQLPENENFERPHFWQYLTVFGLLREARRAGEVDAGLDAAFTAEAILAPLTAQTYRFQRERLGFTPQRIGDGLARLVSNLNGAS
jgi:AcrR family transcriptional regulator